MNKRGVVIIFSLLALTLLSAFLGVMFSQTMNETKLVRRQADSVWALWLAEAGIAKVKSYPGAPSSASGVVANPSDPDNVYSYDVPEPTLMSTGYYNVISTGTVTAPGSVISRTLSVTMKTTAPDPSKFGFCVETTGEILEYKNKNVENDINPADLVQLNSQQSFTNLFGMDMAAVKANATTLDFGSIGNTITASGITWVDVPVGGQLDIQHLNGTGVLFVNGNFRLNGIGTFDGIVYVVGTFDMLGNATINGTVFVESNASIDAGDLTGSSMVSYDPVNIANALNGLASKTIVSWKEN